MWAEKIHRRSFFFLIVDNECCVETYWSRKCIPPSSLIKKNIFLKLKKLTFLPFLLQRLWSSKSDVWSFGVTLWEIFTYCQEPPLAELTDEQVVDNLKHWFHSDGFQLYPTRPNMQQCTKEMFDLIKQCWSREPEDRPLFLEIHQFLQNKCLGFSVD